MRTCRRTIRIPAPAAIVAALLTASSLCAGPKQKTAVFRGEVVRFNSTAITVRSAQEPLMLHTFTYAPKLREKVIRLLETGGYEYGEKVKVRYVPGTETAVAIHGKTTKAHKAPKAAKLLRKRK